MRFNAKNTETSKLMMASTITLSYPGYLAGFAMCCLGLVLGLKSASSSTATIVQIALLLILFLSLRYLSPIKYSELLGEDPRNVLALCNLYLAEARVFPLPVTVLEPLSQYSQFPGISLLLLFLHQTTGVSLNSLCIFLPPLLSAICVPTFYALTQRLFRGKNSSLAAYLCVLFVAVLPFFIYWHMMAIPQQLALVIVPLLILALRLEEEATDFSDRFGAIAIGIILAIALAVSHHLTPFVVAFCLLGSSIVTFFLGKRRFCGSVVTFVLIAAVLSMWLLFPRTGMPPEVALPSVPSEESVMQSTLFEHLNKIVQGMAEPSGVITGSYWQQGLFSGHNGPLIVSEVTRILVIVCGAILALLLLLRAKSRSHTIFVLAAILFVSTALVVYGLFFSGSVYPERMLVYAFIPTVVFGGFGLAQLAKSHRLMTLLIIAVLLVLAPTPFKLFRFLGDPPPAYVYNPAALVTDAEYGRLSYKGEAFLTSADFVAHTFPNTVIYGDHATSHEIVTRRIEYIFTTHAYAGQFSTSRATSPFIIFLDERYIIFLKSRMSGESESDIILSPEYFENFDSVYCASQMRVYAPSNIAPPPP
jgi:hypothetical protein